MICIFKPKPGWKIHTPTHIHTYMEIAGWFGVGGGEWRHRGSLRAEFKEFTEEISEPTENMNMYF